MFKNIAGIFQKRQNFIKEEILLKSKIDKEFKEFIKQEILKKTDIVYELSYTVNKGIIKIEINNKLIAQEVALRIRMLEERLKNNGVLFKKLLI